MQVLFAFLLTLPFAAGFNKVDVLGRWLFFIALLSAAIASVCFITPAAQHRLLFRTGLKEKMLHRANALGIAGAAGLAVAMTSSVALVAETVINAWPAAIFAGVVALLQRLAVVHPADRSICTEQRMTRMLSREL